MVWAADPYWKKRVTGAEVFNSRRVDLESLTEKLDMYWFSVNDLLGANRLSYIGTVLVG
jgi:hypothetical protein